MLGGSWSFMFMEHHWSLAGITRSDSRGLKPPLFHSSPPKIPGQTFIGVLVSGNSVFNCKVNGTLYATLWVSRSTTRSIPSLPLEAIKLRAFNLKIGLTC